MGRNWGRSSGGGGRSGETLNNTRSGFVTISILGTMLSNCVGEVLTLIIETGGHGSSSLAVGVGGTVVYGTSRWSGALGRSSGGGGRSGETLNNTRSGFVTISILGTMLSNCVGEVLTLIIETGGHGSSSLAVGVGGTVVYGTSRWSGALGRSSGGGGRSGETLNNTRSGFVTISILGTMLSNCVGEVLTLIIETGGHGSSSLAVGVGGTVVYGTSRWSGALGRSSGGGGCVAADGAKAV